MHFRTFALSHCSTHHHKVGTEQVIPVQCRQTSQQQNKGNGGEHALAPAGNGGEHALATKVHQPAQSKISPSVQEVDVQRLSHARSCWHCSRLCWQQAAAARRCHKHSRAVRGVVAESRTLFWTPCTRSKPLIRAASMPIKSNNARARQVVEGEFNWRRYILDHQA